MEMVPVTEEELAGVIRRQKLSSAPSPFDQVKDLEEMPFALAGPSQPFQQGHYGGYSPL